MIGDTATIRGFAALGVIGFAESDAPDVLALLARLAASGEYAIIFITERLAEPILSDIGKMTPGAIPAVVIVPDQGGARGIGFTRIRSAVEKALGIDLMKGAR
jgi:V/A-type H+-transporting ATPase subunit F